MIKVPFRGIVEIVGGHDVGKTIAALQTAYPYDKTVFVDDDMKGDGTVKQMKENGVEIEKYINLGEMRVKLGNVVTADDLLKKVVFPVIDDISKSHHEVIIWDTWRIVYQAARQHVERNQALYKDVVNFKGTNEIVQGLISRVARGIEQKQLNQLRSSCELLIITHHLKDKYVKNVMVGETPESSSTFSEVSNMRMWLRRNPGSKVPVVLFLKRPSLPKIVDGTMQFVNLVPTKITPLSTDKSIWETISRYEAEPFESREALPDEIPTAEEYAVLQNTLTVEQRQYVLSLMKYQESEAKESQNIASAVTTGDLPPSTGVEVITRSMTDFNLNGLQISEILNVPVGSIMAFTPDEAKEAFSKIIESQRI